MLKNQCIVMAIFQHFSFGPPYGNYEKKSFLNKLKFGGASRNQRRSISCLSHWEPRNLPRPPSCGQDDQTLTMCEL